MGYISLAVTAASLGVRYVPLHHQPRAGQLRDRQTTRSQVSVRSLQLGVSSYLDTSVAAMPKSPSVVNMASDLLIGRHLGHRVGPESVATPDSDLAGEQAQPQQIRRARSRGLGAGVTLRARGCCCLWLRWAAPCPGSIASLDDRAARLIEIITVASPPSRSQSCDRPRRIARCRGLDGATRCGSHTVQPCGASSGRELLEGATRWTPAPWGLPYLNSDGGRSCDAITPDSNSLSSQLIGHHSFGTDSRLTL